MACCGRDGHTPECAPPGAATFKRLQAPKCCTALCSAMACCGRDGHTPECARPERSNVQEPAGAQIFQCLSYCPRLLWPRTRRSPMESSSCFPCDVNFF